MISPELPDQIIAALRKHHGGQVDQYTFPPPVFETMQGQILDYDPEQSILCVRFPVLESWLNPYGMMQGGMLAAAIDNAIGPLGALVAPANVTRHMEVKYSRPVTPDIGFVAITARLVDRQNRWLTFKAEAKAPDGLRLARAKARHWILDA